MSRKALLTAFLTVWGLRSAAADPAGLEPLPWSRLSDRRLTTLGKEVLRAGRGRWVHGETEHFVLHAFSWEALTNAADLAEYAWTKVSAAVGREGASRKGHIFVVEEAALWSRVQTRALPERYGLAMQLYSDLFVLADTNAAANAARLPHEMVHFRLWQIYGRRTPLWLDEGLASHLGWAVARSYYRLQGRTLVRVQPAAPVESLQTVDRLTSLTAYPVARGAMIAFSRQSEELVAGISARVGLEGFGPLLRAVIWERVPWKTWLRDQHGFTDRDFAELERVVLERSRKEIPAEP